MRLINTTDFSMREWKAIPPPYAMLSHRWSEDDQEVSYRDFLRGAKKTTTGYSKVIRLCRLAREAGIEWAWIDTCCIDKDSSAELSEAINSMFAWYKESAICFVFFTDADMRVFDETLHGAERNYLPSMEINHNKPFEPQTSLEFQASWFGRGWTLQELLAPRSIIFYHVPDLAKEDTAVMLGTKTTLCGRLSRATGIARGYLLGRLEISNASIARRMSWASRRTTTRVEDIAYSLLGIFDVNISLLYGEGNKAFLRLQESILNADSIVSDDTIFAWTSNTSENQRGLLSTCPAEFGRYGCLSPYSLYAGAQVMSPPLRFTGKGIELQNVLPSAELKSIRFAILFWRTIPLPQRKIERVMVRVQLDCGCTCPDSDTRPRGIFLQLNTFVPFGYASDRAIWESQWTRHSPQDLLLARDEPIRATVRAAPVFIRPWIHQSDEVLSRSSWPIVETQVAVYEQIAHFWTVFRLLFSFFCLVYAWRSKYGLIIYLVGYFLSEDRTAYLGFWVAFTSAQTRGEELAPPKWLMTAMSCYIAASTYRLLMSFLMRTNVGSIHPLVLRKG